MAFLERKSLAMRMALAATTTIFVDLDFGISVRQRLDATEREVEGR